MPILRRIIFGAAGSIDICSRYICTLGVAAARPGRAVTWPLQVVIGSECWGACARTDPHAIMPQCCNKVGAKMAPHASTEASAASTASTTGVSTGAGADGARGDDSGESMRTPVSSMALMRELI